jgi:hypothetical protein
VFILTLLLVRGVRESAEASRRNPGSSWRDPTFLVGECAGEAGN